MHQHLVAGDKTPYFIDLITIFVVLFCFVVTSSSAHDSLLIGHQDQTQVAGYIQGSTLPTILALWPLI